MFQSSLPNEYVGISSIEKCNLHGNAASKWQRANKDRTQKQLLLKEEKKFKECNLRRFKPTNK